MATNMTVKITVDEQHVTLSSPYHPDLPAQARALGGKWNGKAWTFDVRDEARVRELAISIYGTDGAQDAGPLVTLLVDMDQVRDDESLWMAGREIACRPVRDGRVRLGDGVSIVSGGFAGSGGSAKHPRMAAKSGTILRVRDVPQRLASDELGRAVSIERAPDEREAERNRLSARRDELLAELHAIEAQLMQLASSNQERN